MDDWENASNLRYARCQVKFRILKKLDYHLFVKIQFACILFRHGVMMIGETMSAKTQVNKSFIIV